MEVSVIVEGPCDIIILSQSLTLKLIENIEPLKCILAEYFLDYSLNSSALFLNHLLIS